MIRSNYTAASQPPPAQTRQKYVPGSFIGGRQKAVAPPHLTTLAASEKSSRLIQVRKLNDDKKSLTQDLNHTRSRQQDVESQLLLCREDLSKTTRALMVTRKMFAALADEKNKEKEKALAAMKKASKLESKLGLAIGQTGLAKKNSSLREMVRKLRDEKVGAETARQTGGRDVPSAGFV